MDAPFIPKRPYDPTTEPFSPSAKRRHQPPPISSSTPPPPISYRQPPNLKLSANETLFRILCPATRTGSVIGKGGAVVRQITEETGARIRIDDSPPHYQERVIVVIADSTKKDNSDNSNSKNEILSGSVLSSNNEEEGLHSAAQVALLKVFERIIKVDEEGKEERPDVIVGGGVVCCRLLAPSIQVGYVLGRGGINLDRIRRETGALVKVLPRDQMPPCSFPGDELIEISGTFLAARKALLSISGCLQDNPAADASNPSTPNSSVGALHGNGMRPHMNPFPPQGYAPGHQTVDHLSRSYPSSGAENNGMNNRMYFEEEVVFKLLCQVDKVGSLIGKGGSIVRVLQAETGASIKIAEAAASDSDEKIVVISARENSEQNRSPAQEAVIRVHGRISEIGYEPGVAVVARLLVHSNQMGFLFGNGGAFIAEIRRATGASICIFPKEQVLKYGSPNEEVVQIIGNLQSVQDSLFQITSRLRETIFPFKPPFAPSYLPPHPDMPPPFLRPIHDPSSPGYSSPRGFPRGTDHVGIPAKPVEPWPALSRSVDRHGPTYPDHVPYPYGSERRAHGQRPSSPGRWTFEAVGSVNATGAADTVGSFANSKTTGPHAPSITIEVVIPQVLLGHIYGENNKNLDQIRQMSGSNVVVHDPRPGATEGTVVVSGTPDRTRIAQILIHVKSDVYIKI
ncbi:RNA-binding KH domain-containing protein [Forsythia ovata]|uniref:RNA-binding KH domain-containing protein n=1 Tax=Forsythia ovata TaxID=205694 RepID=A0ABD1TTS9_9LAMI